MSNNQSMSPDGEETEAGYFFNIDALNEMDLGDLQPRPQTEQLFVSGLTRDDCKTLISCFEKPACSETIFILERFLGRTSRVEQGKALELFGFFLKKLGDAQEAKSQETLASIGIYFSLFLRRSPNLNFYVDNEHFIVRAQRAYYPYIALYVVHFLIPAVIVGVDLNMPFDPRHEVQAIYGDPSGQDDNSQSDGSGSREGSPERSPSRRSHLSVASQNSQPQTEVPIQQERRNSDEAPERREMSLQIMSRLGFGSRMADYEHVRGHEQSQGIQKVSVISKIINICPLNSQERKILNDLRRQHDLVAAHLITRLGLKSEKFQFALYLDDPSLVDEPLVDENLDKAIFLHANRILNTGKCTFMPHHFDRSVRCLNYEMVHFTAPLADWVSDNTLDDLLFFCKTLKHAYCLEILKIVATKKIALCMHQIKKLPEEWQSTILSIYTTPRWKNLAKVTPIDDASIENEKVDASEHRDATLDYYRLVFSSLKPRKAFLKTIQDISTSLANEEERKKLVEKIKESNKLYYKMMVSSYADLLLGIEPTIVNEEDSYLNDIYEIPRNFIIPCLEGTQLFLFDHGMARKLIDTRRNFYNRNPLSLEVLAHVRESYGTYNRLGLSSRIDPISEVLAEVVSGRQLEESCECASKKSYAKKLIRTLRHYRIKEQALEAVAVEPGNMRDLVVKLGMIAINLNAAGGIKEPNQLWREIYHVIKTADPEQSETLKRTIATLILVYSRGGGGYIIHY